MNNSHNDGTQLFIDSSFTEQSLLPRLRTMDLTKIEVLKMTNSELTQFKLPPEIVFPNVKSCFFVSSSANPTYLAPRRPDLDTGGDRGLLTEIDIDLATSFPGIEILIFNLCPKLSKVELFHGKDSPKLTNLNVSKSFESSPACSQFLSHIQDYSPNLKQLYISWLQCEEVRDQVLEVSLDKCQQLESVFYENSEAYSSILLRSERERRLKRLSFHQNIGLKNVTLDPTLLVEQSIAIDDYNGEARLHANISALTTCQNLSLSGRCWREFDFENAKFENLSSLSVFRSCPVVNLELHYFEKEGLYTNSEALELQDNILRALSHPENFPALHSLSCEFVQDVSLFIDILNQLPGFATLDVMDRTASQPFELSKPTKLQRLNIETGEYPHIKISNQDSMDELTINCLSKCSSIEISDCPVLSLVEIYSLEGKCSFSFENCPELVELKLEEVTDVECLDVDERCKSLEELTVENDKPFRMNIPDPVLDNLQIVSLKDIDELSASFSQASTIEILSESHLKNLDLRNTTKLTSLYVKGFPTTFSIEDTSKLAHVTASEGSQIHTHFKEMLARADSKNLLKSHGVIDEVGDHLSKVKEFYGGAIYQDGEETYCHFEGSRNCPICLEELSKECVVLECGHSLHDECLKELSKDSTHCPLCNSKLRSDALELTVF